MGAIVTPLKTGQNDGLARAILLDRLQSAAYLSREPPAVVTLEDLAEKVRSERVFLDAAVRAQVEVDAIVEELVLDQAVPILPTQRYTPRGLQRRRAWERRRHLEREVERLHVRAHSLTVVHPFYLYADEVEALEKALVDQMPAAPVYRAEDFASPTIYALRGEQDTPRERFTLYPGCASASGSPRVSWAGLDPLQHARALTALYQHARHTEGWPIERLALVLAAMQEIWPEIGRRHPENEGTIAANQLTRLVHSEARVLGITIAEIEEVRIGRAGSVP